MRVWTTMEILRCLDLLARCGDQLVCMRDVFIFIPIHSVVELVGSLHIDLCGLMVSFFHMQMLVLAHHPGIEGGLLP